MRKSFTTFALTLALLLVSVGISAQSVTTYLSEDFNTATSGSVPTGWDNQDYAQGTASSSYATNYLWKVSSGGYNGTSCAYLYCYYYYVSAARLKTPSITLSAQKDAMVTFKLKNSSATVGDFSLYVSTDGGTTYSSNPLVQHELTGTNWTEYSYPLSAYKGQTIKLVFEGAASSTSAYYYLDDVVVKDAPTCQAPDGVYITGLTGSGATVNWGLDTRYGFAPDQFSVTLKDASGNTVYHNGNVAGTNTSFSFTGLSGNTTYTAWVRSNCQPSYHGTSDSVSVQFTTLAAAVNPPYYQNFDSLNTMSDGNFYYSNASLNTVSSYAYGNTGKSIKLTTTVADGAYIVFPLINIAANNIEMDYYIRRQTSSTANVVYYVGYTTDPSDIEGTFVPVVTDSLPKNATWVNKRFNTGSLSDQTSPVMLCVNIQSGVATNALLDNVDIHVIPTCTRPENLTITNYAADNVTLDWSMANANNVRVYAMNTADSSVISALATTHPYTMTGLTPQTTYQFTVRGICSSSDSSEVSTPVSVTTRCSTRTTPLFFEGAETTTGSALPDCWENGHIHKVTTNTSDPFYTGTTQKHTGSRGFILRDMTSGNIAYLCSQQIDFGQTAGAYSFRYWYYRPSGTSYVGEGLKIMVTPTPGDTTNAVQVIPFVNRYAGNSPTGSTGWNEYEGVINYTGLGYIMVVGYSKYGSYSYFDDMEVFATPTCPKPSGITVGNATQTTAEISWTAGNAETQWLVSYTINQGSTPFASVTDTLVSGQPLLTINGLATATTYTAANVSVRAFCGVGDTSEVVTLSGVSFTTQCGALTAFPYTMSFEENETYVVYSTYRHPMCWTHYNDYATTTSSYHYYPYAGTSYPRTGTRALYYYAGKTSSSYADTAMFALPQIDTTVQAVNGLRIKFWARNSSSSYSMPVYVGVMTNPNDPSTFVKVDSVTVTGNTYFESTVSFANYAGTGEYIAFLWVKADMTTSYSYIYMDDITLEPIPSCIDLAGGLNATAVTDTTASFSMTDQTATNWQYAYGLTGTAVTAMTPVNATGTTLTLTGLTEATTYDIYVRRDCGNNDYSPWAQVTTFSTTAVPAQMPYTCGFEDVQENARWQYTDGAGVNVFTVGTSTSGVYAGSNGMYVTNSRTTGTHTYTNSSSTKAYAYRTMHFDAKGYQVEMKAKCTGGESTWDFGRILLTSTTEVLPSGTTGTSYGSTTFPNAVVEFDEDFVYSNYKMLNSYSTAGKTDENGWVTISYFLDMTNRPGDYNLVLMWNDDSSGGTTSYPLAVDNIHIYELTCIPPSAILTDSISSTGFKLNLQHQTATQFEVVVDDESFTKESVPDSAVYRQIVNNPNVWITGLTANTQYYYAVRTICGANDTSNWSTVTSVNTFCAMVNLPVTEGFESTTSTNCWQNISENTGSTISRYTGYKHSGTASMKLYQASAVSPELNVTTLAADMINGWCYATTDSVQFTVGVMTDPNDAGTYIDLTTVVIPTRNTWTEFTSYFTSVSDPEYSDYYNARYIVLDAGNNTIYFDDLIIDQTPTCPKPTEVSITNIGAHQFDISFTNNAPGCTSWEVTTNGTPHIITTNPATITGLAAATSYSVQIAAICSATDISYYTTVGNIKTTCDVVIAPYTENFETHTVGSIPDCWDNSASTTSTMSSNPHYVWGVYNYSNNNMLRMYNYLVQSGHTEILTPQIGLPAGNGYEFKYDISPRANSGNTYVYVQVFGGTAGFVCVDTIPQSGSTSSTDPGTFSTRSIDLSAYAGDTITIKFENAANYGSGSIFLDNLSIKALLNCSDPNTPTVSNITATSATVQFTDTCSAHNDWQYVYGQAGFDPSTATPQTVDSSMSFTLTGLSDETDYTVYVRANCGAADGYSNWIQANFKTLCLPFHVTSTNSFSEDFSDFSYGAYINTEGVCYDLLNEPSSNSYWAKAYPTSTPSATATYKYCYGRTPDNMDKCLYWYQYQSYLPNGGAILRRFHLDADSVYELSAWGRSGSSTSYATRFSAVMGTSTTALDTLTSKTVSGSSVTSVYDGTNYWYYYNNLYQQIKTVVSVDSTGDYYIGFFMKPGNSYSYVYAYLDEWTMRAYSGCAPKVATVSNVTSTSAHVTMSAPAYQFEYVLNDTTAATTIVDSTEFDLTGLNSASAYTLYYRTYCDSANYSEWMSAQFTTACGIISNFPYSQDFEAYTTGSAPICWDNSASTATSYSGALWGVYSYSGNKMLHMWNYNTASGIAVIETPTFALPAQPVEVAFDYTNNVEANDFLFKISTNGGASYSTIGTYPTTGAGSYEYGDDPGTFTHVVIDLTNYAGQNVKFQLYNQATYGYGAVFFDNMTISFVPPCRAPQSAPTITGTTMTTLSAQASMATKDTIEFGIAPYSATVTTASITDTVLSTDGNCTFTGLTGSTTYAVWYRYHCDSNEVSDWSRTYASATTMSTDCFDPQNLRTIGIVNDHHAEITWGAAPSALSYVYELYQGANASGTLIDSAVTTQKPDTIVYDSLAGNTAYYFRVRGFCSGDTTAWVGIAIQTTFPTMAMPFICDFENATTNNAWQFNNFNTSSSNEFIIGSGVNNGGLQALYVTDDASTHNYTITTTSNADAEVLLEMPAGNYLVQYDWEGTGESCCDYGRVFLVPSSTTISSISTSLPSGAIGLDNGSKLNMQSSWTSIQKIVSIPTDGVYKLVVGWHNDGSVGTQPPLAIDNIRIEEILCMPLASVNQTGLTSHSAKYEITRYTAGLDIQYGYSTIDNQDSITWTTVQNTGLVDTVSLTGLTANTQYYLFAREICDSTHISAATRVAFQTPNDAQTLPFICSFENTEATTSAWTLVGADNEFVIGAGASSQGSQAMYISDDGSTWNYTISTTSNSYAYVPLAFGDGTYDIEYDWQAYGESSYDYARVFLAPASFIPTAGTMASGIGTTTTPTGWIALDGGSKLNLASGWQSYATEQTFSDSTTLNLLVFWHNDGSVGTQPPFAIDNINITKQLCTSLSFDSISADTIGLDMFTIHYYNPTPGASTQWIVSSNSQYTDTVAMGVCPDSVSSFTATGLSSSTMYYCSLRSVCGVDTLSKALKFNVRTNCAVISQFPYDEGFEDWSPVNVYYTGSSNQFTNNCWTTTPMIANSYYGCPVDQSAGVHSGNQGVVIYNGYSSTTSQLYALPEMDSLNGKFISLYYYTSSSPYYTCIVPELGYINTSGSFVTITSLPTAASWVEFSTTLSNIPAGVKRVALQFPGALYAYLDDIHINNVVPGSTYNDTICHGAAYSGHGFTFNPGQLQDGDTTLTRTIPATLPGVADSVTTLNIHVRPEIMTTTYDTICSGQPYNRGMWQIANPQSTMYLNSFTSVTGCDSTCYLYLYVYPTSETITDTICQGQSYQFGDTTLTATGTYFRTITNKWGCSVTTTLNLLVESTADTTNATICSGESYQFCGNTYTQSGTYNVNTTTTHGCTVVKTLNLTVMKSDSTLSDVHICAGGQGKIVIDTLVTTAGNYQIRRFTAPDPTAPLVGCYTTYHFTVIQDAIIEGRVSDYACQDIPYYGNGIQGVIITQDTVIDVTTKNTEMCDSVTHVALTFTPTSYGSESVTIAEGETYTWHDQSLNQSGVYVDTISSSLGCDSVCTLNLTVGSTPPPSGVDNISDVNINIVPNPVNTGATAFVYGNFGEVKTVEILNNFGQVIDQFEPKSYPIEVSGISASGLYYVRITTVDGQVHLQKLVVK